MNKIKLLLILVSLALIIACGYIITIKVDICETTKNESYALGFNQGMEYFNQLLIYQATNNEVIPYWANGTYYELPFAQICGEQNGN